MKLITKSIENSLPPLYSQENKKPSDIKIKVKFFAPWTNSTWYAYEYDPIKKLFFGLCDINNDGGELGYFSLEEIESIKGPYGLKIERDRYFKDYTLEDILGK
jgi:hypothetical protein